MGAIAKPTATGMSPIGLLLLIGGKTLDMSAFLCYSSTEPIWWLDSETLDEMVLICWLLTARAPV